jgi:hypothetical protein
MSRRPGADRAGPPHRRQPGETGGPRECCWRGSSLAPSPTASIVTPVWVFSTMLENAVHICDAKFGDKLIGSFTVYRQEFAPLPVNRSRWSRTLPLRQSLPSRTRDFLTELRERTEQVEAQSQELVKLNQQLEQRVADQVGEIERLGRLRRFLPPQVADLIVASGTEKQLESHRREITALFCDPRGFTSFSESSDPEDVALLREYHVAIVEIIIRYSGTLERYAGDGSWGSSMTSFRSITQPSKLCRWHWKCAWRSAH